MLKDAVGTLGPGEAFIDMIRGSVADVLPIARHLANRGEFVAARRVAACAAESRLNNREAGQFILGLVSAARGRDDPNEVECGLRALMAIADPQLLATAARLARKSHEVLEFELLRRAHEMSEDMHVSEFLAMRLEQEGRSDEALKVLADIAEAWGELMSLSIRLRAARIFAERGQMDTALEWLEPAAHHEGLESKWRARLGLRAWRRKDFVEAHDLLDRAVNDDAAAPPSWIAIRDDIARRLGNDSQLADLEASAAYSDAIYAKRPERYGGVLSSPYIPVWSTVAQRLSTSKAAAVVDLGCGPGQFAEYLLRQAAVDVRYTGIDFSEVAVRQAEERGLLAQFVVGDLIRHSALDSLPYDTAVALEVLEHLEDDLGLLKRLRGGTRVIGSVPNFDAYGHVRYFAGSAEVEARYGATLEEFDVEAVAFEKGSVIFVFTGTIPS